LHGGPDGFFKKLWDIKATGDNSITLAYLSLDREQGFPGNLAAQVTYTLTNADELRLEYRATTDRPTVVNLTGHGYFNLGGESGGDIVDHQLWIDADFFLPTDETSIPTGEIQAVRATPFDFTAFTRIGAGIESGHEQIRFGNGYDRCWMLRKKQVGQLRKAASLQEPGSGRTLEVWTTEPGIQFYSGNFLEGVRGKNGYPYPRRSGLCLETQHFPDSPNQAHFPSTVLRPGQQYRSTTVYKASVT
jgi:aldose 1-epimerase